MFFGFDMSLPAILGGNGSSFDADFTQGAPGALAFQRGGPGTYFDPTATMQNAGTDVARFDTNPATLAPRGLLLEGQRTNLVATSNGAVGFSGSAVTVTPNADIAPDGNMTATMLTTTNAAHACYATFTVTPSTNYVFSFYVKRGTMTDMKYSIYNQSNLSNIIGPTSYYSQTSPAGYTRISVPFTTPANCTSMRAYPLRDSDVTGTMVWWGAQLEEATFESSLVLTSGSQATRALDLATYSSLSTLGFNPNEGTVFVEFELVDRSAASAGTLFSISDNTQSNIIYVRYLNTGQLRYTISGPDAGSQNTANTVSGSGIMKMTAAYKAGDNAICLNGGTVSTLNVSSVPVGLAALKLARNGVNGEIGYVRIRRVTYYPERLSNEQLQALTA